MCERLMNGETDGVAMTLTTAHHFAGNIKGEEEVERLARAASGKGGGK